MPKVSSKILGSTSPTGASTKGNGGRKLIGLPDGTMVAGVIVDGKSAKTYQSTNSGEKFTDNYSVTDTSVQDLALGSDGNLVFTAVLSKGTTLTIHRRIAGLSTGYSIFTDSAMTAVQACTLVVSPDKSTIHICWSAKTSSYPNSFNLRYVKGNISGSAVSFGSVEQITTANVAGTNYTNPTIMVSASGVPVIMFEYSASGAFGIGRAYKPSTWTVTNQLLNASTTLKQMAPSSIFVPKLINNLTNGRMWLSWTGEVTAGSTTQMYIAYSNDSGVTWSTPVPFTGDSTKRMGVTSITADATGLPIVAYERIYNDSDYDLYYATFNADGTVLIAKTSIVSADDSEEQCGTIYDMDFTRKYGAPPMVYTSKSSVDSNVIYTGFIKVTTPSLPPGDVGDIETLVGVPYSITSEEGVATITEKLNGKVVATKNIASGVLTTLSITPAQWDEVAFGKFQHPRESLVPEAIAKCSDISRFQATNSTIEVTKNFPVPDPYDVYDSTGIIASKTVSVTSYIKPQFTIPVNAVGECYIAIVDAYLYDSGGNIAIDALINTDSGIGSTVTSLSDAYTNAKSTGKTVPVITKFRISRVDYPGVSYLKPQIKSTQTSNTSFGIDNLRVYRISQQEYDALSSGLTLEEGLAVAKQYPRDILYEGARNTLEISMGSYLWTYTFNKVLPLAYGGMINDGLAKLTKASNDFSNAYLGNIKKRLIDAVNVKGGDANIMQDLEEIIVELEYSRAKPYAFGTITATTVTMGFTYMHENSTVFHPYVVCADEIGFNPTVIIMKATNSAGTTVYETVYNTIISGDIGSPAVKLASYNNANMSTTTYHLTSASGNAKVSSKGFTLPVLTGGLDYTWYAFQV